MISDHFLQIIAFPKPLQIFHNSGLYILHYYIQLHTLRLIFSLKIFLYIIVGTYLTVYVIHMQTHLISFPTSFMFLILRLFRHSSTFLLFYDK